MPQNQVTTIPVMWDGRIIIASGEIRPRVRSPACGASRRWRDHMDSGPSTTWCCSATCWPWSASASISRDENKNTDDYFRGGKQIPWWAAGCSIFATMLSSLTFTGIPSKAFAQDWVYAVGNMMIPVVAFVARLRRLAVLPPDRRDQCVRVPGKTIQPAGAVCLAVPASRCFTSFAWRWSCR